MTKIYHTPIIVTANAKNGSLRFGATASCKYWLDDLGIDWKVEFSIGGKTLEEAKARCISFLESGGKLERVEVNLGDKI